MKELVFATNNKNKLKELREIVVDSFRILSLEDIGCTEDIEETAATIEGNAEIKAMHVKQNYGYDCFSDDTGLEIEALNGAPGVYSARYGGVAHDSERNIDRVLGEMLGEENRAARFRTAVFLAMGSSTHLFEGEVKGKIMTERHGTGGFGYDSIFQPLEGDGSTFAEMTPEQKNAISHRGRAVAKLVEYLKNCAGQIKN